jgi:hypothetical protein
MLHMNGFAAVVWSHAWLLQCKKRWLCCLVPPALLGRVLPGGERPLSCSRNTRSGGYLQRNANHTSLFAPLSDSCTATVLHTDPTLP